jgi:hypothetical protein
MVISLFKRKIKNKIKNVFINPIIKKITENINKNSITENIIVNLSHQQLKRPYKKGENIDIVFLFQAASFWPSWETVWEACIEDDRINPIMLVSDDPIKEKVQFQTARSFLEKLNIAYKHVSEVNLSELKPHIIVLHTPYDGHRPRCLHAKMLSSKGYRIVYIPYGIEISDIERARNDHFRGGVTMHSWRLYTFSKEMIPEYKMHSPSGGDMVRSFGHPKFDKLNKKFFPSLPDEIKEKAKGRKVVLWKVHFPKVVDGKLITPSLSMYNELLRKIKDYSKELFFIFMPHPKFYEQLAELQDIEAFKNEIKQTKNMIEYNEDDYRPVIMNCDYYIVDRSALMIEAGITKRPILYVSAKEKEAMTKPIEKIIDTYYQASTFQEIYNFLENIVLKDNDPLYDKRIKAFNEVILHTDGKSGFMIKEDMVKSLINENI